MIIYIMATRKQKALTGARRHHEQKTQLKNTVGSTSFSNQHYPGSDDRELNVYHIGMERGRMLWPDHPQTPVFHLDAARTNLCIRPYTSVKERKRAWTKKRHLDERQRLLSAADQRRFLLLLLLHDGGKGHQGGGGRAPHCSQHPGPEEQRQAMNKEGIGVVDCCPQAAVCRPVSHKSS